MSSADVRDMLDLPSHGHPRPAKKHKTVEKRPGQGNFNCIQRAHTEIKQKVSIESFMLCWVKELRLLQSPNTSD